MAKDRTEFLHSLGDKLILGTLVAIFAFIILEHVKASFSEETQLRSRVVESANILSRHYLDIATQTIEEIQNVKAGAESLSRLGDNELASEKDLRIKVSSAASRGISKLNEMSILADPGGEHAGSPESVDHAERREKIFAEVEEFLRDVSVLVTSVSNPPRNWPTEADKHISLLASETSEDVRSILRSEMRALGERKKIWQLDGFWIISSAAFVGLTASILIYLKLPG